MFESDVVETKNENISQEINENKGQIK